MIYKTSLFEFSSIEELEKSIFDKYNSDEEFRKEREKIYYKSFKIGSLILRSTKHTIHSSAKNIDCIKIKDDLHPIGNTGMTALNNGIVNYIPDTEEISAKKVKNCITVSPGGNGTAGAFFYQSDYIVSTGNNNLVEFFDKNFENQLKSNEKAFMCFAKLLTLSLKNKFHCFARNIGTGNDFNRELILLPVYQDDQGEEHISVKTLSYLYDRIKFNEYKKRIAELEREKSSIKSSLEIYEGNIKTEKGDKKVFYKAFRVGNLFEKNNRLSIKASKKELESSNIETEVFNIRNLGMTRSNNGITSYLKDEGEVNTRKLKGYITFSAEGNGTAGYFFYQNKYFVSTGHHNLIEIKSTKLFDKPLTDDVYISLAAFLTAQLKNKFHNWNRTYNVGNDFNREIILLPCYEDNSISTSKMAELYQSSVIKSKEDGISERERAIKQIKTEMLNFIKTI